MRSFKQSVATRAILSILGMVVSTTAWAQQAPTPVPVATVQPVSTATVPALPTVPAEPDGAPAAVSALPESRTEAGASVVFSQAADSGQTPPIMSSKPPPFSFPPGQAPATDKAGSADKPADASKPAAADKPGVSNDANTFAGFPQVQDLSQLLSGKFENTKYKWYGFVRLDGIFDLKPIGSTDDFVTSSIPVPQGRGQNAVLTPRYTRLGWDTETPWTSMDWTIKTRIEVDFFNGNTSGAFGSFPLRLRFAWIDFGPFLVGQAASQFMDYDVFPNVLDYEGPGGMVLMRQLILAARIPLSEQCKFTIAVEQPYSDIQWYDNGNWDVNPGSGIITTPGVPRNIQDVPDLTANFRYTHDYGHLQVAGIARKLTFQPGEGNSALDELGYGVNFTGTFHPWALLCGEPKSGDCATPCSKSRVLWQYAAGHGINRYIQDVNGFGLDATFDPINGFRTIPSDGWFVAYEQWWAKNWASNFTYGENSSDLTNTLPGNTYEGANYVSANIIWLPVERMGVGLEYLHGFRRNKDGQKGDATRIQLGLQYKF